MQLKIKRDNIVETDNLSLAELQDINDEMQIEIDKMEADIFEAKAIRQATGEYASIDWFKRINLALKLTRRNKDKLIRVITEKKKAEKQNSADRLRFERVFMQVVFEMFGREQYHLITTETHRRIDEATPSIVGQNGADAGAAGG